MDLEAFQQLGERIRRAYLAADYDEHRLPEIAAEALARAELPEFDLAAAAAFLCDTEIPQEPGTAFSDVPIRVYHSKAFYVQLLVWIESTTNIHEHAFSGAFRVLAGSSIHSSYRFDTERSIGSRLKLGQAHLEMIELLEKGDVRPIFPGHDGLTHALFHLDQPSVTVVVRTPGLAWAGPQYAIRRPHFAYAAHELRDDQRVGIVRRIVDAMKKVDEAVAADFMVEQVTQLDFPKIFALHADIDRILPDESQRERFFEALRARHGELADRMADAIEFMCVEQSLTAARRDTTAPHLRFFLALLLNAPTGSAVRALVQKRYPAGDPEERCADWLAALGDPQSILDRVARDRAAQRSRPGPQDLLGRLSMALAPARTVASTLAHQVLRDERDVVGAIARAHPDQDVEGRREKLLEAGRRLRQLPELAVLFRD